MNELGRKVRDLFVKKFEKEPSVYFSPGRINLIGEHIDYNDGFVMPCAINKGIYFALAKNDSNKARFYSRDFDEKAEVDLNNIGPDEEWRNYVYSVLNEFQKEGRVIGGFDCVFGGNIPIGAGLSSSAALDGGLAFALNDLFSLDFSREQLAFLCQRAEHGFPEVNCGIMDPYANLLGQANEAIFLDCQSLNHRYLPLDLKDYQIVLINTRVHHALASSAYNTRRSECETGLQIIRENSSYKSFRDIKNSRVLEKFEAQMGKFVFKRCTFVVDEINRTQQAATMLKKGKLKDFGELMFESHEGLSNLFKVSCAELDFLVHIARKNESVIGARMMGGGFGGCTISLVHQDGKKQFVENSLAAYRKEFQTAAESYDVVTADGTHKLEP